MPLPQPDRAVLAVPPLVVTIAQVRFEEREAVASAEAGTALVERAATLGLSEMTQIHRQQLIVAPGGPPEEAPHGHRQPVGWQFSAKDRTATLTTLTDQMTMETKAYRSWDGFASAWRDCLNALNEIAAPSLTTRVGLRYVNRVIPSGVSTAAEFKAAGLVEHAFLGPAVDSDLSEYVTASEGRVMLSFPDDIDALVQHGVVAEATSPAFVLDIDCFQSRGASFGVDQVMEVSSALNERSLQIFQTVVREPLRTAMKGDENG